MKSTKLNLALALMFGTSMIAAGCGHSNDQANNPTTTAAPVMVPGAPTIPVTQPGYPGYPSGIPAGAMPTGCYPATNTGTTTGATTGATCAPCPAGWAQQTYNGANYCVSTGVANSCGAGMYYNGYTGQCQYASSGSYYWYGCPYGTNWSAYYNGCVSQMPPSNCSYKTYLGGFVSTYVCI